MVGVWMTLCASLDDHFVIFAVVTNDLQSNFEFKIILDLNIKRGNIFIFSLIILQIHQRILLFLRHEILVGVFEWCGVGGRSWWDLMLEIVVVWLCWHFFLGVLVFYYFLFFILIMFYTFFWINNLKYHF